MPASIGASWRHPLMMSDPRVNAGADTAPTPSRRTMIRRVAAAGAFRVDRTGDRRQPRVPRRRRFVEWLLPGRVRRHWVGPRQQLWHLHAPATTPPGSLLQARPMERRGRLPRNDHPDPVVCWQRPVCLHRRPRPLERLHHRQPEPGARSGQRMPPTTAGDRVPAGNVHHCIRSLGVQVAHLVWRDRVPRRRPVRMI